jgi:hypothetical protein
LTNPGFENSKDFSIKGLKVIYASKRSEQEVDPEASDMTLDCLAAMGRIRAHCEGQRAIKGETLAQPS